MARPSVLLPGRLPPHKLSGNEWLWTAHGTRKYTNLIGLFSLGSEPSLTSQRQRGIKVSGLGLHNSQPQEAALQNLAAVHGFGIYPGNPISSMAWPQDPNSSLCRTANGNRGSEVSLSCGTKQTIICVSVCSNSEGDLFFKMRILSEMLLDYRNKYM